MSDIKKKFNGLGDSAHIGEELLHGISEKIAKCKAIEMCVRDHDFKLEEALKIYDVSEIDYNYYLLCKNIN